MDKLKSAFAGILLVVTLHLLDGWEQDGRSEERCRHVLDIVETYGRMCGGKSGDDDVMEDGDEEGDGEANDCDVFRLRGVPQRQTRQPLIYEAFGINPCGGNNDH